MRLFPACCVLCEIQVTGALSLCRPCLQDLPRLKNTCYQCGLPLANQQEASVCGQCQQSSPPIDYLMSSLHYAYPVNYLLSQLKFKRDLTYAKIFSHIMLATLQKHYAGQATALPDIIIPIPLHKKRSRQRGFNQALEIAKPLARKLNIPLSIDTVQRIKYTQAQSLLSAAKRRKNLHHSFIINQRMTAEHIVLVDDVVTTGTTVYELATLLKQSGVKKVGVWAVARAVNKKES
jgi:ComF family protein